MPSKTQSQAQEPASPKDAMPDEGWDPSDPNAEPRHRPTVPEDEVKARVAEANAKHAGMQADKAREAEFASLSENEQARWRRSEALPPQPIGPMDTDHCHEVGCENPVQGTALVNVGHQAASLGFCEQHGFGADALKRYGIAVG